MFAKYLALEAIWMESVAGRLDVLALGGLAALGAGVGHVLGVTLLAVHGLLQLVASSLNTVPTPRAGRGSLGLERWKHLAFYVEQNMKYNLFTLKHFSQIGLF